jgi:hypothetical protein
MERVETLCNLLKEKLEKKASVNELLSTVKMIESELLHLKKITPPSEVPVSLQAAAVSISAPMDFEKVSEEQKQAAPEEKTVEVLQVDEAELEAELEEIKKNAEERNKILAQNKPPVTFDTTDDIPTLAQQRPAEHLAYQPKPQQAPAAVPQAAAPKPSPAQHQPVKEVHELLPVAGGASLNEKLSTKQNEVSDALQDIPVKDLKKAIGINDRYLYINELFRGDEPMYERSIKTINGFAIFPEAEYWIRRELKSKLGWDDKAPVVKQFDQLVRRRFS